MKRGFTLIELLAVIVILALIALIATPIVLKIINNAKTSSTERSKEMYLGAVENSIASAILHDKNILDGTYIIMGNGNLCNGVVSGTACTGTLLEPKLNGTVPTSGTIIITKGKITTYSFTMPDGQIVTPDSGLNTPTAPEKCTLGQIVYFDPKTTSPCNSTTFDLNSVKSGKSTCYKWRALEVNDDTSNTDIKIMLDHNITNALAWVSSSDYVSVGGTTSNYGTDGNNNLGPVTALRGLATATSEWVRVDYLNYTYDTTKTVKNYGILKCTDGSCKNGSGTVIATGLRARMLTGEEIATITNTVASTGTISKSWTQATTDYYYFSNIDYKVGTLTSGTGNNKLSWLIENTDNYYGDKSGATANQYGDNNTGYWLFTTLSNNPAGSWEVGRAGNFCYNVINRDNLYGVRPVITIKKSMLSN